MTDSNESCADADIGSDESGNGAGEAESEELPPDVVDEAERLTRLERAVPDDAEASAHARRRAELLAEYEFTPRVRDDDDDAVLVLYPSEWREDGVVRTDRIDDVTRAIERPLEGTGDPDDWAAIDAHNRDLVERVRERHGNVHGDNAAALADFVGNHYAKTIEELTGPELAEFRTEYFVRNAWPSAEQRDVIDDSITLVYETAGVPAPERWDR